MGFFRRVASRAASECWCAVRGVSLSVSDSDVDPPLSPGVEEDVSESDVPFLFFEMWIER